MATQTTLKIYTDGRLDGAYIRRLKREQRRDLFRYRWLKYYKPTLRLIWWVLEVVFIIVTIPFWGTYKTYRDSTRAQNSRQKRRKDGRFK